MGRLRAGCPLVAVVLAAVAGCSTRYIYVDSRGVQHESSRPIGFREVVTDDLRPDPTNPTVLAGTWRGYGNWSADVPSTRLQLGVNDGTGLVNHYVSPSHVSWSDGDRTGRSGFSIAREAGTFTFDRHGSDGAPAGTVRFASDRAYASAMAETFGGEFPPERVLRLALTDVSLSYARAVHGATVRPTVEDDQVLRLRRSGIDADYCAALRKAGFTLEPEQIVSLRRAGIDADYARDVRAAGYGTVIDQIVSLRRAGIDADYLSGFASAGYRFTSEDVIKLRRAGIDPAFAAELRKGGYDMNADDLIRLRRAGVDAQYAVALQSPPREPLTADEIVHLRRRGVDAETVRKLRR